MSYDKYKELVSTESIKVNIEARLPGGKAFKSKKELVQDLTEYCQWLAHHAVSTYCGQTPNKPFKHGDANLDSLMVSNCARCGNDHNVKFRKLTRSNNEWTHWGLCPTNGEPIMMKIVKDSVS